MGSRTEVAKNGLRRHPGVSRHMVRLRPERRHMGVRRLLSSPLWPRHVGVKPCACQKTLAEDRSGEDTRRCEDTVAFDEDNFRRQVGRRHASSQRHVGTKTYPEDGSGKDTPRCEDTRAQKDTSRRQVGRRHASSRRRVGAQDTSRRQVTTTHSPLPRDDTSSDDSACERQCVMKYRELLLQQAVFSKLLSSLCQVLFAMAQLQYSIFPGCVHTASTQNPRRAPTFTHACARKFPVSTVDMASETRCCKPSVLAPRPVMQLRPLARPPVTHSQSF